MPKTDPSKAVAKPLPKNRPYKAGDPKGSQKGVKPSKKGQRR